MSWCDKLASTPIVGFTLDLHFVSTSRIVDAFAPVFDKLIDGDRAKFTVDPSAQFAFGYTTEDGFNTAVEPAKVSVAFVHRLQAKTVSGGPPQVEMLSHPLPYTQLLPEVLKRLVDATVLVPSPSSRRVTRIGIVSRTDVAEDEAPPGIANFVDYMSKPWGKRLPSYAINITSELSKNAKWADRCIHNIVRPDTVSSLVNLTFDWQRTYASGHALNRKLLEELVRDAKDSALQYFEDLAEGKQIDA